MNNLTDVKRDPNSVKSSHHSSGCELAAVFCFFIGYRCICRYTLIFFAIFFPVTKVSVVGKCFLTNMMGKSIRPANKKKKSIPRRCSIMFHYAERYMMFLLVNINLFMSDILTENNYWWGLYQVRVGNVYRRLVSASETEEFRYAVCNTVEPA